MNIVDGPPPPPPIRILPTIIFWKDRTWRVTPKSLNQNIDSVTSYGPLHIFVLSRKKCRVYIIPVLRVSILKKTFQNSFVSIDIWLKRTIHILFQILKTCFLWKAPNAPKILKNSKNVFKIQNVSSDNTIP